MPLSEFSEIWSFTTGMNGEIPSKATLTSPVSESIINSLPVHFQWDAVPYSLEYLVFWGEVNSNSGNIDMTTETEYYNIHLSPGTTYSWNVCARNDYAWGDCSDSWTFTTAETLSDLKTDINYEITESGPVFYFDGQDVLYRNN